MIEGSNRNASYGKRRNANIDLLRIIFSLFVILIHTRPIDYLAEHKTIAAVWTPVIYTCNSGFFILSGYFALNYSKERGIRSFYLTKIRNLLLPWIIYCFGIYIWDKTKINTFIELKVILKNFLIDFFTGNCATHFWFMYALFGMMLGAPFLALLFQSLNNKQCKIFFLIATINIVMFVLFSNFGKTFAFSFFLGGWVYIFSLGYYIRNLLNHKKICILLGIIGYAVSVIGIKYIPNYNYSTDYAFPHIIFSAAIVVFFLDFVDIKNDRISKFINFLGKYTFSIYMIHYVVIYYLPYYLFPMNNEVEQYVIVVVLGYIISLLIAIAIDNTIVLTCQLLFDRIINMATKRKLCKFH